MFGSEEMDLGDNSTALNSACIGASGSATLRRAAPGHRSLDMVSLGAAWHTWHVMHYCKRSLRTRSGKRSLLQFMCSFTSYLVNRDDKIQPSDAEGIA